MNPEEDPEARIRELERPLTDQAQGSELGGRPPAGAGYLPPPTTAYTAPDYTVPAYNAPDSHGSPPPHGAQPYENQPYGSQPYGNQPWNAPYAAPPRKSSAGISWAVFGVVAVVFLVAIGVGAYVWTTMSAPTRPSVSSGGGNIGIPTFPSIEIPSMPSIPAVPAPDTDPNVMTGAPGGDLTVSGIDENKTITCNDANVTISGIRNTVNISGHCGKISVSGMNNVVTVDAADSIGASGFDNRVTYHGGAPQIDTMGSNVVEQG